MIKIKHENSLIQFLYYKKTDFKNIIILKFVYLFILIGMSYSCTSRTQIKEVHKENELTIMTFKKELHDFGKIPSKESVSNVFEFSNTGDSPLLIKEVTTSCGCTVPKWTKEVIKPNKSGEIKIVYDAKYPGRFNKTITVVYNGKDSPQQLTIKGEVTYPEEEENTSTNKIN